MMGQGFSNSGFGSLDEMARQNMAMFEQASRMFTEGLSSEKPEAKQSSEPPVQASAASRDDINQLKDQMAALKDQLDKLAK